MTFMPFGYGPRNCIGMRFALEEVKLALATMITNYVMLPCLETKVSKRINFIIVYYILLD